MFHLELVIFKIIIIFHIKLLLFDSYQISSDYFKITYTGNYISEYSYVCNVMIITLPAILYLRLDTVQNHTLCFNTISSSEK